MMAYDVPTPPAASMGTDFAILGNGEIGIPVHKGPTYSATVGPSGAIADSGPLHQDGPGRGNTDLLEQGVTIEENWMRRTDTRPLIRSAYPEEASNPAPFVRAQVWGEILSRTPPRPHRSPRNAARSSLVSWRGVTPASRASANTAL